MKKIFFVLIILNITNKIYCAIGCMDNSQHTYINEGYDYKNYHYVNCNCPCERYEHMFERGRCNKCGHFRAP